MTTQRQRKTPAQNGKAPVAAKTVHSEAKTSDNLELPATEDLQQKLEQELEKLQQTEKSLQQTIEQLQTQVKEKDALVKTIETKTNKAHAELEAVQKDALKLAEANKKLIAENQQLQTSAEEVSQLQTKLEQSEKTAAQKASRIQAELEKAQTDALNLAEANQKLIEENKQFQANIDGVQKVRSELEKAQKTALQLADSNQKLIEENQKLKEKPPEQKSSQKSSQKSLAPLPKAPTNQPAGDMRSHQEIIRQRQAAMLAHPVFPDNAMTSKVSDQEIGWFD